VNPLTKKVLKKDWILTTEAFQKLLLSFDDDEEKASVLYEEIRKRLIRQFKANCSLNSEEQADEVFNRVARKIFVDGLILDRQTLFAYFHQTARLVLLESQRKNRNKLLGIDDLPISEEPSYNPQVYIEKVEEKVRKEIGLEALAECRKHLNTNELAVLDEYNLANGKDKKQKREQLAESLGKSQNALKIMINRSRKKLIDCAKKKLGLL
jgi:DNA-directed RNA polymerase specialized sigma24 family protein